MSDDKFGDDPKRTLAFNDKFGDPDGQRESAVQPRHPHVMHLPFSALNVDAIPNDFQGIGRGDLNPNVFEEMGHYSHTAAEANAGDLNQGDKFGTGAEEHPIEGIGRFLSDPHLYEDTLVIPKDLADRHSESNFVDSVESISVTVSRSEGDLGWKQGDRFLDSECSYVVKDSFIYGNEMRSTIEEAPTLSTKVPSVNKFGEIVPSDGETLPEGVKVTFQVQDLSDVLVPPKSSVPEINGVHFGEAALGAASTIDKFVERWASLLVEDIVTSVEERLKSGELGAVKPYGQQLKSGSLGADLDGDSDITSSLPRYPITGSLPDERDKFGSVGAGTAEELPETLKFGSIGGGSEEQPNVQAIGRAHRVGQQHKVRFIIMDEGGNPIKKVDKFGGW